MQTQNTKTVALWVCSLKFGMNYSQRDVQSSFGLETTKRLLFLVLLACPLPTPPSPLPPCAKILASGNSFNEEKLYSELWKCAVSNTLFVLRASRGLYRPLSWAWPPFSHDEWCIRPQALEVFLRALTREHWPGGLSSVATEKAMEGCLSLYHSRSEIGLQGRVKMGPL